MTPAQLSRMIENLIRIGTIEEIDLSAAKCRIRSGKLLTNWLPWVTHRAGSTRTWNPPTVGEQVVLFSPSGEPAAGIALTGLFSAANQEPSNSANEHLTVYPDGARVNYNHATGAITVTGVKTALIKAATQVTIDCPDTHVTGALTVDGLLTYKGGMAGSGGGAAAAVIDGDVVIGGISFLGHGHPDPQGGDVGAPQ